MDEKEERVGAKVRVRRRFHDTMHAREPRGGCSPALPSVLTTCRLRNLTQSHALMIVQHTAVISLPVLLRGCPFCTAQLLRSRSLINFFCRHDNDGWAS